MLLEFQASLQLRITCEDPANSRCFECGSHDHEVPPPALRIGLAKGTKRQQASGLRHLCSTGPLKALASRLRALNALRRFWISRSTLGEPFYRAMGQSPSCCQCQRGSSRLEEAQLSQLHAEALEDSKRLSKSL